MKQLVKEAIAAGALGFSTSRTTAHRAIDGEPVPGTYAAEDELFGIGTRSVSWVQASSSSRLPVPPGRTSSVRRRRWTGCVASPLPSSVR